jgi:hypothetical protein
MLLQAAAEGNFVHKEAADSAEWTPWVCDSLHGSNIRQSLQMHARQLPAFLHVTPVLARMQQECLG